MAERKWTKELLDIGRSSSGAWNHAQILLVGGQPDDINWQQAVIGTPCHDSVYSAFLRLRGAAPQANLARDVTDLRTRVADLEALVVALVETQEELASSVFGRYVNKPSAPAEKPLKREPRVLSSTNKSAGGVTRDSARDLLAGLTRRLGLR